MSAAHSYTAPGAGEAYARAGDKPKAIAAFQAGLKAMGRDKITPAPFKEQLRKNAEKRLRELSGKPASEKPTR